MKRHFIDNYIINPTHPVTIMLIGCGGTGSQVLTSLARINQTLIALGHPGIHVTAVDDDVVTEANIGRQLFSESDLGLNKATVLISRINRFFGTGWIDIPTRYDNISLCNIIITCVDNIDTRVLLSKYLKDIKGKFYYPYMKPLYWLDFGNTADSGQVVLGTVSEVKQPKSKKFKVVTELPLVTDMFDFSTIDEKDSGPSCSLAEAIDKQDLFINSTLAQLGCNLLWKMFREGMISYSGLFLNLRTMKVNPIKL